MMRSATENEPGAEGTKAGRGAGAGVEQDKWVKKFLSHLAADRGASTYTQRNYRQALAEFQGLASRGAATATGLGRAATGRFPGGTCDFWGGTNSAARRYSFASARCEPFTNFLCVQAKFPARRSRT